MNVTLRVEFNDKVKYEKEYDALAHGFEIAFACEKIYMDIPADTFVKVLVETPYYSFAFLQEYFSNEGALNMDEQLVTIKVDKDRKLTFE